MAQKTVVEVEVKATGGRSINQITAELNAAQEAYKGLTDRSDAAAKAQLRLVGNLKTELTAASAALKESLEGSNKSLGGVNEAIEFVAGSYGALRKEAKNLKDELNKVPEGTDDFNRIVTRLAAVDGEIKRISTSIKEGGKSRRDFANEIKDGFDVSTIETVAELQRAQKALKQARDEAKVGSDEFGVYEAELNKVNDRIKELNTNVKPATTFYDRLTESVKDGTSENAKATASLVELLQKQQQLSAAAKNPIGFNTAGALDQTKKELDDINGQINALAQNLPSAQRKIVVGLQSSQQRYEQLSQAQANFVEGSKEYEEIAKQLAKVADELGGFEAKLESSITKGLENSKRLEDIGKLNVEVFERQVNEAADRIVKVTDAVASSYQIANKLGYQSIEVQNALAEVTKVLEVAEAGKRVAEGATAAAILATNVAQRAKVVGTFAMIGAQKLYDIAVNTSVRSLKLLKVALVSTGIGAFAVLLGTAISDFKQFEQIMKVVIKVSNPLYTIISFLADKFLGLKIGVEDVATSLKGLIPNFQELTNGVRDFLSTVSGGLIDDTKKAAERVKATTLENANVIASAQRDARKAELTAAGNQEKALVAIEREGLKESIAITQQKLKLEREGTQEYRELKAEEIRLNGEAKALEISAAKAAADEANAYREALFNLEKARIENRIALLEAEGGNDIKVFEERKRLVELEIKNIRGFGAEATAAREKAANDLRLIDLERLQFLRDLNKETTELNKETASELAALDNSELIAQTKAIESAAQTEIDALNERLAAIKTTGAETEDELKAQEELRKAIAERIIATQRKQNDDLDKLYDEANKRVEEATQNLKNEILAINEELAAAELETPEASQDPEKVNALSAAIKKRYENERDEIIRTSAERTAATLAEIDDLIKVAKAKGEDTDGLSSAREDVRIKNEEKVNKKLKALQQKQDKELLDLQKKSLEDAVELSQKTLDEANQSGTFADRITALKDFLDKEKALRIANGESLTSIEIDQQKRLQAAILETVSLRLQAFEDILSQANQFAEAFTELTVGVQLKQNEKANEDSKKRQERAEEELDGVNEALENATGGRARILRRQQQALDAAAKNEVENQKRLEKEKEELEKKAARRKQIFAAAQATIDYGQTLVSIFASAATLPPGFAQVYQVAQFGLATANWLAQLALINAQKFEKGGYVEGKRHAQGGVPAELEGGEFVFNRRAVSRFGRRNLEAMNALNITPLPRGGFIPPTTTTFRERYEYDVNERIAGGVKQAAEKDVYLNYSEFKRFEKALKLKEGKSKI